ncbi:complex I NDUFA9 subunit family protein [Brevundimonas sp.]|uniref:complex I NDUFA9 subunit family protein n=1 Tax=Brevundimonas sp. TaxID=1871086 RepID=UPI003512B5BC
MMPSGSGLVTVFGGSGFVGTQVVRALARRGLRIRVAVRNPNLAHDLKPLGDVGQVMPIYGDITDPATVKSAVAGADIVINLVGILYERPGSKAFEHIHVEGARTVAEAAREAGARHFVQMSAIGADADSPSAYARSKARGEAAVKDAFPDASIVRPSIVFGPGDGFFNRFAALSGLTPALPLIGGGQSRFQPVFVGDVAEAVARVATDATWAGRTVELGGPAVVTFEEVLKMIAHETGRHRLLLPLPFPVARAIGSVAQLTTLVGIPPVLTRDQILLMQTDNVVSAGAAGLTDLGIEPTGMAAVVPNYLWRYRRGGQFAEQPMAETF